MEQIIRTQEEIDAVIAHFKEIKPRVRRFSFFGDDDHRLMEITIEVLEKRRDVSDEYYTDDASTDEFNAARDAWAWLTSSTRLGMPGRGLPVTTTRLMDLSSIVGTV